MRRRRGLAAALGASVLVVLYIAVAASAVAASAGAGAAGASGLGRGLINHEEDDGLRAMCAALDHDNDGTISPGESPLDDLEHSMDLYELEQLWQQNPARQWNSEALSLWASEAVSEKSAQALSAKGFTGRDLPSLASNNDEAYKKLGIRNKLERHRLTARAYDLVIFGPDGRGSLMLRAHGRSWSSFMFSQLLPWTTALTLVVITAIVLHKRGRRRTAAAVAAATSKARVSLSVPTVIETPPSPQPRRKDRTRSVSSVVAWTADDVMEWLSSRGYEDLDDKWKNIDGKELMNLTFGDLQGLGLNEERSADLLDDIRDLSELLNTRKRRRRRPNHDALASPLEEGVSVGSDVFPGVSVPVLASPRSSDAFLPTPAAVGNDSPLSPVSTNSDSANSHPNSAFSTLNTDGSAGSHSARGLAIISSVASQPITMHLTKGVYGKNPSSSQPGLQEVESAELVLLRKIGSGQYGSVFRAQWTPTFKNNETGDVSIVAAKILKNVTHAEHSEMRKHFEREVNMLGCIRHPNIVELLGASTIDEVIIVTSYCNAGSLFSFLHGDVHPNYNLKWVHRISSEIAQGLNYLVSKHILHRDLKSHNILLHADSVPAAETVNLTTQAQSLRACICDFGLARHSDHLTKMTGTPGTPAWMAPEIIRNEPVNDRCDVYSYGVVLWELLTRQTPWEGMEPAQIMFAVAAYDRRPPLPSDCPAAFGQLITSCWHKTPKLRPSFQEIEEILLIMSPVMIYGTSFATEGIDDLAFSQANWASVIQSKLHEFHHAEDLLKVKDVEIDSLRREILTLKIQQQQQEEMQRRQAEELQRRQQQKSRLDAFATFRHAVKPLNPEKRRPRRSKGHLAKVPSGGNELDASTDSLSNSVDEDSPGHADITSPRSATRVSPNAAGGTPGRPGRSSLNVSGSDAEPPATPLGDLPAPGFFPTSRSHRKRSVTNPG